MRVCDFPSCERPHSARGYCNAHYRQILKGGRLAPISPSPAERLQIYVDRSGSCWLWTGHIDARGYGRTYVGGGKTMAVHRLAYELAFGAIPPGLQVDHMCHQRTCIRPDHLQAVTNKQNRENRSGLMRNNTSGVHGVHLHKNGSWVATVRHRGANYYLGLFDDLRSAERAVVDKRNELFSNNLLDRAMIEVVQP